MKQCRSCGGTFTRIGPDGVPYFHVCPRLTTVRVERAGVWTPIPLAALQPTDTIHVQRNGAIVAVLVSAVQPGDVRVGDGRAPLPNPRDERPDPGKLPGARPALTVPIDETAIEQRAVAVGDGILELRDNGAL